MTKDKLVSIIVPIFNATNTLNKCINSLINQTYRNIEIILINDGSTDNSLDICNYYKKKDNRIILKNIPNQGVSNARNVGLSLCKGDYIGFVDSDDYIELDLIENVIPYFNNDTKIVAFNLFFENEFGKELMNFNYKNLTHIPYLEFPKYLYEVKSFNGFACNKIYSRELLEKIKFNTSVSILEDNLFNMQVFEKNKDFNCLYLNRKLYHYVQFKNSAIHKINMSIFNVWNAEINILDNKKIDSNYLKTEYIISFFKYRILDTKFKKSKQYIEIKKYVDKYKKEVNFFKIPKKLLLKYIIFKYFPIIIKIHFNRKDL